MKKVLLAILVVSAPTMAADQRKIPLQPDASYVLVEIGKLEGAMVKGVDNPGSLTIAPYNPTTHDIVAAQRIVLFDKPVAKSKLSRQYVVKVQPATWVIEGASGTAFSLGSKTFVVHPGEIVDLGVMKPEIDWLDGEGPKSMAGGMLSAAFFGSMKPKQVRPVRIKWTRRQPTSLPLPASIGERAVTPVTLIDGATFDNNLGGLINRFAGRSSRPSDDPANPPSF